MSAPHARSGLHFLVMLGLVTCIAILTFLPLYGVRFVTADDVVVLSTPWQFSLEWLYQRLTTDITSGRLSSLVAFLINLPRTLSDSSPYYFLLLILPIIVETTVIGLILTRHLGNSIYSLFFAGLFFASLQNGWKHHVFIAHPLTFHAGFFLFLCSIFFLLEYLLKKKATSHLLASCLFYCLSALSYEAFVPYAGIGGGLALLCAFLSLPNRELVKNRSFIAIFALGCTAALVGIAYVVTRIIYPPTYAGVSVNTSVSLAQYLQALWTFSTSAIPPKFYFSHQHLFVDYLNTAKEMKNNFTDFLPQFEPQWLVKPLLVTLLFCFAFSKKHLLGLPTLSIKKIILISIFFLISALIPNLLVSLSRPQWALSGMDTFTGSFFSVFFWTLLFTAWTAYALRASILKSHYLYQFLKFSIGSIIIPIVVLVDISNTFVARAQKDDMLIWKTMNKFFETPLYHSIPEGSYLYAPSLWELGKYWPLTHPSPSMDNYWDDYIYNKTNKRLKVIRNKTILNSINPRESDAIYFMKFSKADRNQDTAIILSKLENIDIARSQNLNVNNIQIFSRSNQKTAGIYLSFNHNAGNRTILINDEPLPYHVNAGTLFVQIHKLKPGEQPQPFTANVSSSSSDIDPESARVVYGFESIENQEMQELSFKIEKVDHEERSGCYGPEFSGVEYQWCTIESRIFIKNKSDDMKSIIFEFYAFSGLPGWNLKIALDNHLLYADTSHDKEWIKGQIELRVKPGLTTLGFFSQNTQVKPFDGDTRKLAFGLRDITIKQKN